MKIDYKFKLRLLGALALPAAIALSSCTAEPDESNRFTFTGETVNDFLLHNDSLFSDFNYILRRSGQDRLLSSYGTYTCFAPKNAAIQEYVDSLYDDPESLDENGNKLHNGMTGPGLEGLTDSLCLDIVYYHLLKTELTTTEMLTSEGASYRTMLGRSITAGQGTGRQILVNNGAPIDLGMCDQELVNGYLHAIDKCIPRSNRVVANELKANIDKFSIFYEALEATGLDEAMNTMEKTLSYTPPAEKTGYYIPTECKKGFTLFAEPNWVFNQHGIYTFPQLVEYCKEVYGKCATGSRDWDHGWYDYFRNNGIEVDMSDNYTKENNVVHMFVAYHMLKAAVNPTVLAFRINTYSGNGWTNESYDYYETMLPKTLIKAWRVGESSTGWTTYINRYVTNNTLTDGKMTNEHIPIPEKTAEELKTVLADLKFESREAPMFFSPLTSDDWTLGHRLPAIAMPHPNDMSYQEFMRDYPSLGFVGRKTPEQNQPVWELLMKIENITVCKVEGVLFRTAPDPMSGATGQRQDDIPFSGYDAIEAIREDTEWSVDNGWANDTMLVTNLTFVEGFDEATMIRFLNTLPVRMYSVCRILPRRVIILPDHMGSLQTNLLDKTDYRKLDKSGVYYAYAV